MISNIGLTGRLGQDLENIKTFDKFDLGVPLNKKPLPTQAERRLYSKPASFNFTSAIISLDMAINAVSGRLARLKLIKANEDLAVLVEKGIAVFPTAFFTTNLNIPEEDILVFMYFCADRNNLKEYIAADHTLLLIDFLQGMAPQYRAHRGLGK